MKPAIPRGLYAITDRALCGNRGLHSSVAAALAGGAVMIQYRDKTTDSGRRRDEARQLARLCREHGALFIVNDDPELAARSDADGVHLGRDDQEIFAARRLLGPDRLLGASCYDSLALARDAVAAGCDYVAFGSAFPSPTKPGAVRAPVSLYRQAAAELPVPVAAIGGITPDNAAPLVAAGCRLLAVISGVFDQSDPRDAAARYVRLFASQAPRSDRMTPP